MKPYTVILLYPDYVADSFGETYLAHVEAADPDAALLAAQEQALRENGVEPCDEDWTPEDFAVAAMFDGHLTDLKYEAQAAY